MNNLNNSNDTLIKNQYIELCNSVFNKYVKVRPSYSNYRFHRSDKPKIKQIFDNSINDLFISTVSKQHKQECVEYYQENPEVLYELFLYGFFIQKTMGMDVFQRINYPNVLEFYNILLKNKSSIDIYNIDQVFRYININYGKPASRIFVGIKDEILLSNNTKKEIGRGSYGTVYRPPIASKNDTLTLVGKVFKESKNFQNEIRISEFLTDVNKGSQFLVLPETITDTNAKILQIRYGYAGIPYTRYIDELKDSNISIYTVIKKTILLMINFIKKYNQTFGNSQLVHLDIKPDNVMFDESTNELRLIDFSLVKRADLLYTFYPPSEDLVIIEDSYVFWSPEYNLYNLKFSLSKLDETSTKKYIEHISKYFKIPYISDNISRLLEIIFNQLISEQANIKDVSYKHGPDAWGIGITFILYIQKLYLKFHISSVPDLNKVCKDILNVIFKNCICVNKNRNLIICLEELEQIYSKL